MDIFHGRTLEMDLLEQETSVRTKTYKTIEHLNAAVNLLRALGKYEIADQAKEVIRLLNAK